VTGSSPLEGIIGLAFAPDGDRAVAGYHFKGSAQGFSVDAAGAILPAGSPVEGSTANGVAVSPDGHFAYVVTAEGILGFALGADGSVSSLGPVVGSGFYGDLAITPDGRHLFAGNFSTGEIEHFEIAASGALTPSGTTAVSAVSFLTVSPDGRFLFVGDKPAGRTGSSPSRSVPAAPSPKSAKRDRCRTMPSSAISPSLLMAGTSICRTRTTPRSTPSRSV
jgi:DNA-binding beta-propeller fold protein YncE